MGLTGSSVGRGAIDYGDQIKKDEQGRLVALAGNPNVGKSTVFNALTGMRQHTGNWPGKTVTSAQGYCTFRRKSFHFVDLPGTYSLLSHSQEEEVARNFICFGGADAVVVVCDATCLERNLNLVLQTMELSGNVIVCVNLMDEAKRKGIHVNLEKLSKCLGVPAVGVTARKKKTLSVLMNELCREAADKPEDRAECVRVRYPRELELAVRNIETVIEDLEPRIKISSRWLALNLLETDCSLLKEINLQMGENFACDEQLKNALSLEREELCRAGIAPDRIKDVVVTSLLNAAEEICSKVISYENAGYSDCDRKIDRVLTGRRSGYPVMLLLLAIIFWITISGANYPSRVLADLLFKVQDRLSELFAYFGAPAWLHGALVLGVYRVLAWVVSVMLPPMAIFFPLFTLLEDAGYLPRIAYNLDKPFQRCCACGKQALTMCMGFGCNAAGIVGCRIIDSPRERLLAILTNNFVPCNGRFPTLIAILTMFFIGTEGGALSSLLSALLLTVVIVFGILATFVITRILSCTLLKGVPSSYTLELPPYRRPQLGRAVVRSMLDRTIFLLGRAAAVAAPAGLIIWLTANISIDGVSLLRHMADFLDPFAKIMGLDGVILIAFILGFPANEIVIPIIIMAYMSQGSIIEMESLSQMKQLFVNNGWTWVTAVCTMLFSLMHWPCSTTLITMRKETGSIRWTLLAAAIPTIAGIGMCIFVNIMAGIIC